MLFFFLCLFVCLFSVFFLFVSPTAKYSLSIEYLMCSVDMYVCEEL